MMYLDHYGLREAPFRLTPLTDFFFSGAKRGATVDALIYAILHDEGIVKVSGEVGAGKTMLCRVLLERLPDTVDTVYFANPTLDPEALLRTIARELGLALPAVDTVVLLGAIQDELIARHGAGRRVVALIDEAHAMPAESLEQIRLLSNLETGRHKLLQLVLFGQPELDTLLETRAMRPLRDRITHHFRLDPLAPDEVAQYLDFRMRAAGYRGPELFSPAASRRIASYAGGLTRRVNVLADKSLLAAFSQNMHAINPSHVKVAARDAQYLPTRLRRPGWLIVPVLLLIAVLLAWQTFEREVFSKAAPSVASDPGVATTGEPPPAAPPPIDAAPVQMPAEPVQASPAPEPARVVPLALPSTPDTPAVATPAAEPSPFPLTDAALAAQAQWMAQVDDDTWFIQLHTNTDAPPAQLEAQIARARAALPDARIRAYSASLGDATRTGVVTGSYATEQDALSALQALPADYRARGAYIRQARRLR